MSVSRMLAAMLATNSHLFVDKDVTQKAAMCFQEPQLATVGVLVPVWIGCSIKMLLDQAAAIELTGSWEPMDWGKRMLALL